MFMRSILLTLCSVVFFSGALAAPIPVFADSPPPPKVALENPLGTDKSIPEIFGGGMKVVLGLLGSLALLAFFYGAMMWLFSFGSPEKIKKGTQSMLWAGIGVLVIFSAYAILNAIIEYGLGAKSPEESTTSQPAAGPTSLCGQTEGLIEKFKQPPLWSAYTCATEEQAGEQWKYCKARKDYTNTPGKGCGNGPEKCCPPPVPTAE